MRKIQTVSYAPEHGAYGWIDLYWPETTAPCPMFIYFHGGGLTGGDRAAGVQSTLQRLAAHGIAVAAVEYRLMRFHNGQLCSDSPQFPDFVTDAARAVAWLRSHPVDEHPVSAYYVGGSSAGAYLSLMLFANPAYLGKYGIDPMEIDGYLFDAGQPTTHFNVLNARGQDGRLIRIDEAAPLYWIDHDYSGRLPKLRILYAESDMVNRPEQTRLLYRTLLHFRYDPNRITLRRMDGYTHCAYCGDPDVFAPEIEALIASGTP